MAERDRPVGLDEYARDHGVTRRTVELWISAGMPVRRQSRRVLVLRAEANAWRDEYKLRAARDQRGTPDEAEERARKVRADADIAELRLATMRGDLVPRADALLAVEVMLQRLRGAWLSAPGRWAPRILGLEHVADAVRVLRELVDDVLVAAQADADEAAEATDDDQPHEAAA